MDVSRSRSLLRGATRTEPISRRDDKGASGADGRAAREGFPDLQAHRTTALDQHDVTGAEQLGQLTAGVLDRAEVPPEAGTLLA